MSKTWGTFTASEIGGVSKIGKPSPYVAAFSFRNFFEMRQKRTIITDLFQTYNVDEFLQPSDYSPHTASLMESSDYM